MSKFSDAQAKLLFAHIITVFNLHINWCIKVRDKVCDESLFLLDQGFLCSPAQAEVNNFFIIALIQFGAWGVSGEECVCT